MSKVAHFSFIKNAIYRNGEAVAILEQQNEDSVHIQWTDGDVTTHKTWGDAMGDLTSWAKDHANSKYNEFARCYYDEVVITIVV